MKMSWALESGFRNICGWDHCPGAGSQLALFRQAGQANKTRIQKAIIDMQPRTRLCGIQSVLDNGAGFAGMLTGKIDRNRAASCSRGS